MGYRPDLFLGGVLIGIAVVVLVLGIAAVAESVRECLLPANRRDDAAEHAALGLIGGAILMVAGGTQLLFARRVFRSVRSGFFGLLGVGSLNLGLLLVLGSSGDWSPWELMYPGILIAYGAGRLIGVGPKPR